MFWEIKKMSQNYKSPQCKLGLMDKIACSVNILYERYPYPSLPIHNKNDLSHKLHANIMSKILGTAGVDQSSLSCKEILDAGCGTGEKSCYFAYYGAQVTAIDLSCSSLAKGKKLAETFGLKVEDRKSVV
jgi:2-polyprenyl-3-methyl-5-hydroxy-6-metoxy-1,4-benzoquinol methylase